MDIEYQRNIERYELLRWAQQAFDGFRVVPPGTGICHQVNLEYLARVVFGTADGQAFPDTLVGTDSHTTMVNGLGVLLAGASGASRPRPPCSGQPLTSYARPVVGLAGSPGAPRGNHRHRPRAHRSLNCSRHHGDRRKFVEVYGPGLAPAPTGEPGHDREHGARVRRHVRDLPDRRRGRCAICVSRDETTAHVDLVETSTPRSRGCSTVADRPRADVLELATAGPVDGRSPAWPGRRDPRTGYRSAMPSPASVALVVRRAPKATAPPAPGAESRPTGRHAGAAIAAEIADGHVVIAAITSCTNTSNPQVMLAAGLLAQKAVARGLRSKPWVKTSLAPGSRVVMDYYERSGLLEPLETLGFNLVGFGCTTCIGNSGPLLPGVSEAVHEGDLSVAAVLSGNRNFEGRIHPDIRLNYLALPPTRRSLPQALAGTMDPDLTSEPLGTDGDGVPVYLLRPVAFPVGGVRRHRTSGDVRDVPESATPRCSRAMTGGRPSPPAEGDTFNWDGDSTYVLKPPFFEPFKLNRRRCPTSSVPGCWRSWATA